MYRRLAALALLSACRRAPVAPPIAAPSVENPSVVPVDAPPAMPRFVSRLRPTPTHPLDITFDGVIHLIGYDVDTAVVRRGQAVRVTWYWECLGPIGDDWRLLTHIDDSQGPRWNADRTGEVRARYQPSNWRPGEFIRDEQTIDFPADWEGPTATFLVGVWRGSTRMTPLPAAQDDGGRAVGFRIDVAP